MRTSVIHLLLAASALLTGAAAHAGLVLNGSFENNAISGAWQRVAAVDGWTSSVTGNTAFEIQKGASQGGQTGFAPTAADGIQYLELNTDQYTTISQSLATTAGARYTLSFAYASRPDTPGGVASAMDVYWNNTKLTATPLAGAATGVWTTFTLTGLVAGVDATSLRFASVGPASAASYGSYLDNVSVTAVPEPFSLALVLLGLAGIGLARRRSA